MIRYLQGKKLYPIGRPVRATITLYPIGRPVRATITLYRIGRVQPLTVQTRHTHIMGMVTVTAAPPPIVIAIN